MSKMLRSARSVSSTQVASASKRNRILARAVSTEDPCSTSHQKINTLVFGSDTRRRQVLGSLAVTGVALLFGSQATVFTPPAAAKVTIAEVKKGGEGERDVEVTASGIRMSVVSVGRGDPPKSGSLVLVDVVGRLEDGTVFLDTKGEGAAPLAFQMGTTNKLVTEGLMQVVETMRGGDVKLAVVPASLGYGSRGVAFKSGARVPPDAPLYYEVSLLRCQELTMGLACCADADFPCIKKQQPEAASPAAGVSAEVGAAAPP